jgi:hypothetical protein
VEEDDCSDRVARRGPLDVLEAHRAEIACARG